MYALFWDKNIIKGQILQSFLCVLFLLVLYVTAKHAKILVTGLHIDDGQQNPETMSVYKKESVFNRNGYVKSATYFADEWPINFWNSEMDFLEEDLKQIQADGFDSIILVIPWREFQPEISPIRYNDYAFDKLEEVMYMADVCGLEVYARIGYTWDFYRDFSEDVVDRYCNLLNDKATRDAWKDYVRKMFSVLSGYTCFKEGFLTWEDFWNTLGVCDEPFIWNRRKKAEEIGFQDWVRRNYSLKDYNASYGKRYMDYSSIPIPRRNEAAMEAMYAFYDDFLNDLLVEAQGVFPNISMEVRLDWDVIYTKDGSMDYYKHTNTFSCMNSGFTAVMYGIPMGFENVGERVSYEEAIEKTEYMLKQVTLQNEGKPVFIEQFIFADNTPKFSRNAKIKEEELNDYLCNVSGILHDNSKGYGIWTYKNYRANMIYNSQFVLGKTGWKTEGDVEFKKEGDSMVCHLGQNETVRQLIPKRRNHFDSEKYTVEFDIVKIADTGKIIVVVGNEKRSLEVKKTGRVCMEFSKNMNFDIGIQALDCDVMIDNLRLYAQVQQGFLYDENNKELQCITGIRQLNRMLQ